MEILPPAFVCYTLILICFAADNNSLDEKHKANIQKREKQCLIEDDIEGPEHIREGRQSNLPKANSLDPLTKVPSKGHLQSKIPVPKSPVIRSKQQKVSTKLPLYIKAPKVSPVSPIRLPVLPNENNNTIINSETDNIKEDQPTNTKHITYEHNKVPIADEEDAESKSTSKHHSKIKKVPHQEISIRRGGHASPADSNDSKPDRNEQETTETTNNGGNEKSTTHLFVDETDPTPAKTKQPLLENRIKKPIKTNDLSRKTNIDEEDNENIEPPLHITNGTHIISIKKLTDEEKHKMSLLSTPEEACLSGKGPRTCARIINNKPNSTTPAKAIPRPLTKEESFILKEIFGDNNIDVKEKPVPNESITIVNHDYEEYQERPTAPPEINPTNTFNNDRQEFENYYQPTQNIYCNPYYKNLIDQYKQCYEGEQSDLNNFYYQHQNCDQPTYFQTPDSYFAYNQLNDITDCKQGPLPEIFNIPEQKCDNNFGRIWRSWKDFEIRLPFGVRNDNCLFNNEEITKLPIPYLTQSVLNGFQNGPIICRRLR